MDTLLTGGCDDTIRVFNCKTEEQQKQWLLNRVVERVIWDHFNPYCSLASTD